MPACAQHEAAEAHCLGSPLFPLHFDSGNIVSDRNDLELSPRSYNFKVDDPGEALRKAREFADTAYAAAVDGIAKDSLEKLVEAREQLAAQGLIQSSVMGRTAAQIYGAEVKALVQARLDGLLEGFELYEVPLDEALVNRTVDELMASRIPRSLTPQKRLARRTTACSLVISQT